MTESARRPGVSILAGLLALVAAVAAAALLWYLPVPRQWWSLALFVLGPTTLAILSGLLIARGLRPRVRGSRRPGSAPAGSPAGAQ